MTRTASAVRFGHLLLWDDMLRVLHDPDLHDKFDALLASHASLPVDDAVEAPQTRPETPSPKSRRPERGAGGCGPGRSGCATCNPAVVADPPIAREDLHRAAVTARRRLGLHAARQARRGSDRRPDR